MFKPTASSGNAPASPGNLWDVPKVDMEAEKRAQFAAEEAAKQQMTLEAEAKKAAFGDNAKLTADAAYAARMAGERAQMATRTASRTAAMRSQ